MSHTSDSKRRKEEAEKVNFSSSLDILVLTFTESVTVLSSHLLVYIFSVHRFLVNLVVVHQDLLFVKKESLTRRDIQKEKPCPHLVRFLPLLFFFERQRERKKERETCTSDKVVVS